MFLYEMRGFHLEKLSLYVLLEIYLFPGELTIDAVMFIIRHSVILKCVYVNLMYLIFEANFCHYHFEIFRYLRKYLKQFPL